MVSIAKVPKRTHGVLVSGVVESSGAASRATSVMSNAIPMQSVRIAAGDDQAVGGWRSSKVGHAQFVDQADGLEYFVVSITVDLS